MKILITNDDGIKAPGIAALAEIASKFGDIYVIAPHQNNSAVGHGTVSYTHLDVYKRQP